MDNFTDANRRHLDGAIAMIRGAMSPNVTRDASLSLCAESIAQSLSDASHIKVGADPRALRDLIPTQREWFRKLAERAIATTEPNCYDDAKEATVASMLNAEYRKPMDTEELIRETLATFLAEVAR